MAQPSSVVLSQLPRPPWGGARGLSVSRAAGRCTGNAEQTLDSAEQELEKPN